MTQKLYRSAIEGSTYGIRIDFHEVSDNPSEAAPITPNAGLTWSLTDADRNIINDRLLVPIDSAPTVYIVLSGDDLALPSGYPVKRYVTVVGSYDSLLGENLPLIDQVSFQIENLVGIPIPEVP